MLNASQMETLSICRRNNLEEKNAFVFLASCGFRLRRQRTLRILLSTCQCFLGILQVPVTVWHSLLRSKKFGDVPKLKGKVHGTESQGSESCQSSQETSGFSLPSATGKCFNQVGQMVECDLFMYREGWKHRLADAPEPCICNFLHSQGQKHHLASQSLGFPKWDEGTGVDNL